jgi:hypothetical protein
MQKHVYIYIYIHIHTYIYMVPICKYNIIIYIHIHSIYFPTQAKVHRHTYSLSTNRAASCACSHLPARESTPSAKGRTPQLNQLNHQTMEMFSMI